MVYHLGDRPGGSREIEPADLFHGGGGDLQWSAGGILTGLHSDAEQFVFAERVWLRPPGILCVSVWESYESKEHQDLVRSFLNGRFENTAFCILSPDGKERLSGTGRSPRQGLGQGRGVRRGEGELNTVVPAMEGIAKKYRTKNEEEAPVLPDFHTFRQALNVTSGDQRLLIVVGASGGG